MTANELRSKFIEFFKSKNHVEISGQSLIPENDSSVLFTTAGMHPLVPYLLGERHPAGNRLVDYQKCVRTGDIDSVGDESHLTCFEMLGNWSLGDYFKKESIAYSYEFLTSKDWLALDARKLSVTVFEGDENAPADEDAARFWKENGMPEDKIAYLPASDNWWAAGATGPCGPDTEIFYWTGEGFPPSGSNKKTDGEHWMEIWNNVFMQFNRIDEKTLVPLPKKNVDTGMGLERTNCVLQGKKSVYLTEVFQPIIGAIEKLADYKYGASSCAEKDKSVRIIADHARAAVFIIGDQKGISPSNVGAGYVLRRLIRRAVRHGMKLGIEKAFLAEIALSVIENFKSAYPELEQNKEKIQYELTAEENKFRDTLKKGEAEFQKLLPNLMKNPKKIISGKVAFRLYDTFGFPVELTSELADENGFTVDIEGFKEAEKKHQEVSKSLDAGKAKGGLAEQSDITTKYHTATHLLQQALINVLGNKVAQKGSNINNERMRFDFTFDRAMTKDEIAQVESIVNEQIKKDLPVTSQIMTLDEAKAQGAKALFANKYGEKVTVYTIGAQDDWFSKEVCGGPHVQHTAQIGDFKIQKEQSSSAGVRRIRAVISGGLPLDS